MADRPPRDMGGKTRGEDDARTARCGYGAGGGRLGDDHLSRAGRGRGGRIEIVAVTSTSSSGDIKFVTAYCPEGKSLIGTGWSISGGIGQVHVAVVVPSERWVTIVAREDDDGTTQIWSVTARAACAVAPAGLEIVHATAAATFDAESVTVDCPSGKQVLGTGGGSPDDQGDLILTEIKPTPTSVTVEVWEDEDGTADPWSVTAFAICADATADLSIEIDVTDFDSTSSKSATATCAGQRAIGGGATIGVGVGEVMLTSLKPSEYQGASFTMAHAAEDQDGRDWGWTLRVYAICLNAFT